MSIATSQKICHFGSLLVHICIIKCQWHPFVDKSGCSVASLALVPWLAASAHPVLFFFLYIYIYTLLRNLLRLFALLVLLVIENIHNINWNAMQSFESCVLRQTLMVQSLKCLLNNRQNSDNASLISHTEKKGNDLNCCASQRLNRECEHVMLNFLL